MEKNNLINSLKTNEPFAEIRALLANCTHKQQVQFALLAAKSAEEFYDKNEYPKVYSSLLKVFEVLEKWLENPKSVTKKELNEAVRAAYAAAQSVVNAAKATRASNAVYWMAHAATYAVDAAIHAAAYAIDLAIQAAYMAAYAVDAADAARNKRYQFLLFELIKLIALDKGYNIAALEVLYKEF